MIIGPAHPLRGGLASFNERLAKEFLANGEKAEIVTFSLQYPGFLFPGTTQYSSDPAPAGLRIRALINSVNPFNWIKTGNTLKKEKYDIIVVRYWLPFMGPCLGTILRIVKKNKHTRIICIADNIIPHETRAGDKMFTRYFIKPVDAFITMSERVMTQLRTLTEKPSKVVAHPLYDNFGDKVAKADARRVLKIGDDEKIMLFFGFIREYKGLDLLLEALAILKAHPRAGEWQLPKLVIAGEFYESRKKYDELIDKLRLHDNVILHSDFIADSQVKNYFCAADVVVQPYRNATQSGVTPLAYHFEVPMVVTNVGGLPDLVPDGKVGLVCEPNPAAIADTLYRYFNLFPGHFVKGLQEEKKKYTWKNLTQAITSF